MRLDIIATRLEMHTIEVATPVDGHLLWKLPEGISTVIDQLPAEERAKILGYLDAVIGSTVNTLLGSVLLEDEHRDIGFDLIIKSNLQLVNDLQKLSST